MRTLLGDDLIQELVYGFSRSSHTSTCMRTGERNTHVCYALAAAAARLSNGVGTLGIGNGIHDIVIGTIDDRPIPLVTDRLEWGDKPPIVCIRRLP